MRAACRFLPAAGVWQAIRCCARSLTTARGCVPQLQDEMSSDSVAWLPSGRGTGPQSSESGRAGAMWRLARSSEPCSEMACPGLVAARCRGWKARMSSTGLERRGLYRGTSRVGLLRHAGSEAALGGAEFTDSKSAHPSCRRVLTPAQMSAGRSAGLGCGGPVLLGPWASYVLVVGRRSAAASVLPVRGWSWSSGSSAI